MDSKDVEELRNNTDDTLLWNKKRGRRVSFAAEITSVHVFDRDDDDLETPPESQPQPEPDEDVPGFFKELEDDMDDNDGEDSRERTRTDDVMYGVGRQPFLQPFESPSPASAFASAISNDADDYFGPVSSEFIRPGRLSDSVASDDNHEITMDSTAFSMHFRSLAKSDSGYLKTPTGSPLVFEEKTPMQSAATTGQGSSMELTRYDESVPRISIPVDRFSSGKDSNDMSLLEDNPHRYNYANVSPRLDEPTSDGSKFPGISTSVFSNRINATDYLVKNSSSTPIQNGSNSSRYFPAGDLVNPSVHASATASDKVREELLTSSHSLVLPSENKNQSLSQHSTATEIGDGLNFNHVEAQMPGIRSDTISDLSSPVPSFGQSTQKEHSHFHSQGGLLKQSETTPKNDRSDRKCQSRSLVIPYPSSLVELLEDSHGNGKCVSDISHNIGMPYQCPPVAVPSLLYDLKVEFAMDASDTSRPPKLIPSEKSVNTSIDVRYSSEDEKLLDLKLNGVASLSRTPVAGDSSLRSKLSSCIKKTPQCNIPVSRLEDQFLDIDLGPNVQRMTDDMDTDSFTPSERLGGSLLCQAGVNTNLRSSSKRKNILRLKCDRVSSLEATPVNNSSIRSKLSSCIVKTPQHGTLVSRLEEHFLSIDQEHSFQKKTADVDYNQFLTTGDKKDLPIDEITKSKGTRGISYPLTRHVEQVAHHLSTLEKFSIGTAATFGNKSSLASVTHNGHSDKKEFGTPVGMVYSRNQILVSGMSSNQRHCVTYELPQSPRRLNHIVNSCHRVTRPPSLEEFYDNTDKSDKTSKKTPPSEHSSVFESLSRHEDDLHLELNEQSPVDRVIDVSPENGELMEVVSSGSYLNTMAQKLDNMFVEQNLYSRSPVILSDQVGSPLLKDPFLSKNSSGVLQKTEYIRTNLKTEAILSSDGHSDSSVVPFPPRAHASVDESPIMVQTPAKEYVMNLQAPESNVHKRGHDQIDTSNQHSAPNVDKPRLSKIQKKEINDSAGHAESGCRSIVPPKHWSAIFSEALAESEQSYATSFDRLDLQKFELLEDVLIQLQKVQNITGICDNIQTQMVGNHNNMERNRRMLEAGELLQKMFYERAKLKLVRVKRDKLQERIDIVRSGMQHCQTMKLNCSQLRSSVKCNNKSVHCDPLSLTAQLEGQQNLQVASHEIPKMRQNVSATQREIDALMYSFYTCFKMKENFTNVDTITLVSDSLKRRALFKSLRDDVQLWEINNMVYKNGQNKINLNYCGYLIQWFTLVAPISTVTVSYVLNWSNIEKKYPNMEARSVFSYVFKENVQQKFVGIRSLALETQVTSSVLSSLLDVIEEVKLARMELMHLKEAKFRSRPARKLDLCLHFVDFKTGMKADITLDISCLSCGLYPSDVFPSQVQPYPLLNTDSFAAGLQAAVEKLKFGSSRILRICRCISNVLASPRL